ncbi:putative beta-amylase [Helianthus debilis subsp. tardiflorus]
MSTSTGCLASTQEAFGFFLEDDLSEISNQKFQGCCLAVTIADMVGIVMRLTNNEGGRYTLSPQPLIDGRYKCVQDIHRFCTEIGLETVITYPFTRVMMEDKKWDESFYAIRKHNRYKLDGMTHLTDKDDIQKAILENFGPRGKKFPILGAMYLGKFADADYARERDILEDPYHCPPNEEHSSRKRGKNDEEEEHAFIITGCATMPKKDTNDTMPKDPYYCRVKNSYGKKWGNVGFSCVGIRQFNYIILPYEYDSKKDEADMVVDKNKEEEADTEVKADIQVGSMPSKLPTCRTSVYVSLPLKLIGIEGTNDGPSNLDKTLRLLKGTGVQGVMVNVCWGVVECNPKKYVWEAYKSLFEKVKSHELKLQVVMCFHKLVEDDGEYSLPSWVLEVGKENQDIFFTDKQGNRNNECLSWGIDNEKVLLDRSALEVYYDFMKSFKDEFKVFFEQKNISAIEIGLGPSGELRYPSCNSEHGWVYPGVGAFQCYDRYMLKSLKKESAKQGYEYCNIISEIEGSYDSDPDQVGFFSDEKKFDSFKTRFFLNWYSKTLVEHGDQVIFNAKKAFGRKRILNVKLSGVYWWYNHDTKSHAAELTTGFFNSMDNDGYDPLLKMLNKNGVGLKFALDRSYMDNGKQSSQNPDSLKNEVMQVALDYSKVSISTWNVRHCKDDKEYASVMAEALSDVHRTSYTSYTYHGLHQLLKQPGKFSVFVKEMNGDEPIDSSSRTSDQSL